MPSCIYDWSRLAEVVLIGNLELVRYVVENKGLPWTDHNWQSGPIEAAQYIESLPIENYLRSYYEG